MSPTEGAVNKSDPSGSPQDFSALGSPSLFGADIPPPVGPRPVFPEDIAVDNSGGAADGNLYVLQRLLITGSASSAPGFYAFTSSGTFIRMVDPPGGNGHRAVAVDSDGGVWLADPFGQVVEYDSSLSPTGDRIDVSAVGVARSVAFDSAGSLYAVIEGGQEGGALEKFDSTGTYVGQLAAGPVVDVAVDPATDHVFALAGDRIYEYDASGSLLDEFGQERPTGSGGDLAAGLGDRVYAADENDREIHVYGPTTANTVADAAAAPATSVGFVKATLEGTVDTLGEPTAIRFQYRVQGETSWTNTPAQDLGSTPGAQSVSADINGLDDGTTYEFRILAVNTDVSAQAPSNVETFTTQLATAPVATIDPVQDVTSTSASFSGEVDPQGAPTTYRFELATQPDFSDASSLPTGDAGEGNGFIEVSEEALNLIPNTHYYVRLGAENTGGGAISGVEEFSTPAVVPVVEALDPGPVTDTSAWLGGYVNPKNAPTTYFIEYSTDPDFPDENSQSIPASEEESAGSGGQPLFVNTQIKGLSPQTEYHYRVVATNVAGTTNGESRRFTTGAPGGPPAAGLPDGRVWEKVSPADKGGAGVKVGLATDSGPTSRAAVDGDAVAYLSSGKFGEEAFDGDSGAVFSQYLARRGPGGWATRNVDPPVEPGITAQVSGVNRYSWFSGDLSKGITTTTANFLPGDVEDVFHLYLRDNLTGTFTTVSNADESTPKEAPFFFRGASANADHVVFQMNAGLIAGGTSPLERLASGEVRTVSVLPDGTVVPGNVGTDVVANSFGEFAGLNAVSRDGTKIYFSPGASTPFAGQLYLREDGESTTLVSASERTGDDPEVPHKAQFLGASKDGLVAYFTSNDKLTDDSVAGCTPPSSSSPEVCTADLYRWDGRQPVGERLTDITAATPGTPPLLGLTAVSDDGSSAYIVTGGPGGPDLRLWREGEDVQEIARLSQADEGVWNKVPRNPNGLETRFAARVTPDGRNLAFTSVRSQTGYDTDGKNQLYLYDRDEDRIVCVSCGTFSSKSKGHSWFRGCIGESQSGGCGDVLIGDPSRNLRPDGTRLVFDSKDALVPEDTNGVIDVYQWSEGELRLISSGTSGFASKFLDASEDGDDIFFTTAQQLVASDKDDLVDLYDARVGGTPEPPVDFPCVADECQGTPIPPPTFGTPSSSSFQGKGNSSPAKPRCRKGKVRRKGRCVARKARKQIKSKQRAKSNRRAGR